MPKKAKKRTRKNNRKAGDDESMYKFAIGDMVMWRVRLLPVSAEKVITNEKELPTIKNNLHQFTTINNN